MQFDEGSEISLNEIIIGKSTDLSALMNMKNLNVNIKAEGDFKIRMNEYLSEILIGNLLSNAVNHNIAGGIINISIRPGFLRICNNGENNELTGSNIFDRFVSGNQKSPGLGLAIVRQICETYNLDVQYDKDELHCFTVQIKS